MGLLVVRVEIRDLAALPLDDVVVGGLTGGDSLRGGIGQEDDRVDLLLLQLPLAVGQLLGAVLEAAHSLLDRLSLVALAIAHQPADLSGELIDLGIGFVELALGLSALLIEGAHLIDDRLRVDILDLQSPDRLIGMLQ